MKNSKGFKVVVALLSLVIVCNSGYALYRHFSTDRGVIGRKEDVLSLSSNINVMLTRSDNWHQIASENFMTHEDFAGIDGSTATIPITAELARQFFGAEDERDAFRKECYVGSFVNHNTTDVAYVNLIKKNTNVVGWYSAEWNRYEKTVGLVFATPPSEDEYNTAKEHGAELEIEPIAYDGFVFITHRNNPVDSLTVEQIRDIYNGKITNWSEVGGNDEEIKAYQRSKNSGSQTAMEELVMNGEPMAEPVPAFLLTQEMSELVEKVAEYENNSSAIGYTYYYYINNLYKNPDIKVINIDGISPDNENLISGAYPFTTAYYAVIRSDEPDDSVYRKLRDYMLTDEGQEIIKLAGYCPVKE